MVYESDFYTTRRPYSRPSVSTYSVTTSTPFNRYYSGIPRVSTYTTYSTVPTYNTIPYIAHKRVVGGTRIYTTPSYVTGSSRIYTTPSISGISRVYTSPATRIISSPIRVIRSVRSPVRVITSPARTMTIRVRPSIINREYSRIENKIRSSPAYLPTESYLNSDSCVTFDDEAREIRTATSSLLRRVQTRVPRAHSMPPLNFLSRYEPVLPIRPATERYITRVLSPIRSLYDEDVISHYPEPRKYVGKSHLASVRICGNRGYNTRKPLYHSDYDNTKVANDVKLMSFYLKNRTAAENRSDYANLVMASAKLDPFRPSRKFTQPKAEEDPNAEIKEKQAARDARMHEFSDDIDLEKIKNQRMEEAQRIEERALLEESKKKAEAKAKREEEDRLAELARQEELAAIAAAQRAADLEAKRAEEERLAAEAEELRIAEEELAAEEAALAAIEEAALAAEEARINEIARLAEEARIAEEEKIAEEARKLEEYRQAEEARLNEEERVREEELIRLAELEQIAKDEQDAEHQRQLAELSELARQEADLAEKAKQELAESRSDEPAAVEDSEVYVDAEPAAEPEDISEVTSEPLVEEPLSGGAECEDIKTDEEADIWGAEE